jgi:hypothetical protein
MASAAISFTYSWLCMIRKAGLTLLYLISRAVALYLALVLVSPSRHCVRILAGVGEVARAALRIPCSTAH